MLEEQLQTWQKTPWSGRSSAGRSRPALQEFRERAPLTTYEDYADALLNKNEQILPDKTYEWIHTSGRSGEYEFKWIPYTQAMYDVLSDCTLACFILGACRKHGQVALQQGDRLMFSLAPVPFISGLAMQGAPRAVQFPDLAPVRGRPQDGLLREDP